MSLLDNFRVNIHLNLSSSCVFPRKLTNYNVWEYILFLLLTIINLVGWLSFEISNTLPVTVNWIVTTTNSMIDDRCTQQYWRNSFKMFCIIVIVKTWISYLTNFKKTKISAWVKSFSIDTHRNSYYLMSLKRKRKEYTAILFQLIHDN